MAKPRIGFLGMGAMGGPMARRLVQSGFDVTGYDVNAARADAVARDGVTIAKSAADAAQAADVLLSLPASSTRFAKQFKPLKALSIAWSLWQPFAVLNSSTTARLLM